MGYAPVVHSKMRLQDKVDSSWHRMDNHRSTRKQIWNAYVGDTHGLAPSGSNRTPLNGHALYARAILQFLAAHQPRLKISTEVGPWKPYMAAVSAQASRVMRDNKFGFVQQRWVLDALMYSPGIIKVCQEWRRVDIGDGEYADILRTYVDNVDFSDWVFDTSASSIHKADFTGHRSRWSIDAIRGNPQFAKVDVETLRGLSGYDLGDNERLFFENDDKSQPYKEKVTLWEIWDKCSGRMKIFPADSPNLVLYDEPWEGHDNGPLHYIDFLDVPNHVVGLSPLCMLHSLIESTNRALSKSIKQTDAAKNVMRITGGNPAEAEALMEAMDGVGVYMDGGGVTEIMNVPGPDPRTLSMVPILKDLYNWLGGNINELAGLGVSAPTATQGELLSQAASGMVSFMQARVNEAVRVACEAIVHAELADPLGTEVVADRMADGQTYWTKLTPEIRNQIDKMLVNIDIDVYSMQYKSPQKRLASIMQWWTGFATQSYQMLAAEGGGYDVQALNRAIAEMMDEPIINEVTIYSVRPQTEMTGSPPQDIKQSPNTTRTNIRMDRGGSSGELGGEMAGNLMRMNAA